MPHWKRLINPDYLGAYSLEPGQDMIRTVSVIFAHHLPDRIDSPDHIESAAVVPVDQQGAGIVHPCYGALCAAGLNRRNR